MFHKNISPILKCKIFLRNRKINDNRNKKTKERFLRSNASYFIKWTA
jgi:hypothetical protein